jgi:uncharacterized membrane protein
MLSELGIVFFLGSVLGWTMEFVFRGALTRKRFSNPSVMNIPFLPVYGAGAVCIYWISSTSVPFLLKIFLFAASTTAVEFAVGLSFAKYFRIRLWDYSRNYLNVGGHICPTFSILWTCLGVSFDLYLYRPFSTVIGPLASSTVYLASLGIFFALFVLDGLMTIARTEGLRRDIVEHNRRTGLDLDLNFSELREEVVRDLSSGRPMNPLVVFLFAFHISPASTTRRSVRRLLARKTRRTVRERWRAERDRLGFT